MLSDEFWADVRRWGWARVFYARLMSSIRRWIVLCRITVRPLTGSEDDAASSPATHRFATKSELIELASHLPDDYAKAWVLETDPDEFNQCWAAFVDGKIVSFVWRAYRQAPAGDEMMIGFERPYRYGLKAYTIPEYRGKHLLVGRACDPFCRAKGFTHNIGFIETHNFASWRRSSRGGNEHAGYAGYFKLGKLRIPFRTPLAKKHSFRFYKQE